MKDKDKGLELILVGAESLRLKRMTMRNYYNTKQFLDALPTMLGAVGNTLIGNYTTGTGRPSGKMYFNAVKSLGGELILSLPSSGTIGRLFITLSSGITYSFIVKRLSEGTPSTLVIPIPFFKSIGGVWVPQEHETGLEDTMTYSFSVLGWNSGYNATFFDKTYEILNGTYDVVEEFLKAGGVHESNIDI